MTLFLLFWGFRDEVFGETIELLTEFLTGVRSDDFIQPRWLGSRRFTSHDFDDVAVNKFCVQIRHFAVNFNANNVSTNLGMETIGKV